MSSTTPGMWSPRDSLQASAHKKRSRAPSDEGPRREFNASQAPKLPSLSDDVFLQVSTHKSLRRKGVSPDQFGDNERLIELGKSAFDLVLTLHLQKRRPMLKAKDVSIQRELQCSSGMIQDWVRHYDLKVLCSRDLQSTMSSDEEMRSRFFAYVGGVFQSNGLNALHAWIDPLLFQEKLIQPEEADKSRQHRIVNSPPKRIKSEGLSPPPGFFSPMVIPTPNTRPALPSPAPTPSARPNPLTPAQPSAAFLPLFNQEAARRRVTVEYLWEFNGHSQAGQWTAKCIVNGICKGEGKSSNKQMAKEEAARNAFDSMGWR